MSFFYSNIFFVLLCLMTKLCCAASPAPPLPHTMKFHPISHKAKYIISLNKNAHYDSGIQDVKGAMEMSVIDLQDRWKIIQKSTLSVVYKDKQVEDHFETVSIEGKNTSDYSFKSDSHSKLDSEIICSQGVLKKPTGQLNNTNSAPNPYIQYTKPNFSRVTLKPNVKFPLQHLHTLIQAALSQKEALSEPLRFSIFDGTSDLQEIVTIETNITPIPDFQTKTKLVPQKDNTTIVPGGSIEQSHTQAKNLSEEIKKAHVWKFKMNVFPDGKREACEPDDSYEQTVNSLGMILSMKVNYIEPEFTVDIVMTECSDIDQADLKEDTISQSDEPNETISQQTL